MVFYCHSRSSHPHELVLHQRTYELFLMTHIVMSVMMCGRLLLRHVYRVRKLLQLLELTLRHECCLVFCPSSCVVRILRLGFRYAEATDTDSIITRIDILGISKQAQAVMSMFTSRP
jgi:hypothetical protein